MKDAEFAIGAFVYEMQNHEYAINRYQGDYDVLSCFCDNELEFGDRKDYKDYLTEDGHEEWIALYKEARQKYFELELEREAETEI